MRDDDEGRAQRVAQFADEIIKQLRAHGIQTRRGLVEKENGRIQRQGPRETGAFAHTA